MEAAQKHFPAVPEMEAPEDLRGLARNGLRGIAAREIKARGPCMDAVFYLLDALRLFREKSLQEIQEITFEIGMLGQRGAGHQRPPKRNTSCGRCRGGPSQRWSCCASCAPGLQRIESEWTLVWIWARAARSTST